MAVTATDLAQRDLDMKFYGVLFVLTIVCIAVVKKNASSPNVVVSDEFKTFQRSFLIVHSIAMFADWLQGAHVYALYVSYDFTMIEISQLFIAGFASSAVFGVFIGAVADRFGRRANCVLYCIAYGLACVTKHFPNYNILMVGRILSGIATSVLASAFETWMRHEHDKNGFPSEWVDSTFSLMTFYGFGVTAISAGLVSQMAATYLGYVGPFDVSLLALVLLGCYLPIGWAENYGSEHQEVLVNVKKAFGLMVTDRKMLLLGLTQSCFEGAMYTFVFMWTPVMHFEGLEIPHGVIFSTFMVSVMIGSYAFKALMASHSGRCEGFMRVVFVAAAIGLLVPTVVTNKAAVYAGFIVFEVCCGIYFPAMGTMRYTHVPKEIQATVMNIYRIGINLLVVFMLTNAANLASTVFLWCSLLLLFAGLTQDRLAAVAGANLNATLRTEAGMDDEDEEAGVELLEKKEMDA